MPKIFPVNGLERLEGLHKDLEANRQRREAAERVRSQALKRNWAGSHRMRRSWPAKMPSRPWPANGISWPKPWRTIPPPRATWTRRRQSSGVNCESWGRPGIGRAWRRWIPQYRCASGWLSPAGNWVRRSDGLRPRGLRGEPWPETATEAEKQAEAASRHLQGFRLRGLTDHQELGRQQEAVRRLRAWLQQREILAEKLRGRVSARDEAEARRAALQAQLAAPAAALPDG